LFQREADEPASLPGHEGDRLGRDQLGGHAEVALVLPILVVHEDHHPARADLRDGPLDLLEGVHRPCSLAWGRRSRSTYLPITSPSRFTAAPCAFSPSVVDASVSGMSITENRPSCRRFTVKETPSTATEHFSTSQRSSNGGTRNPTTTKSPL